MLVSTAAVLYVRVQVLETERFDGSASCVLSSGSCIFVTTCVSVYYRYGVDVPMQGVRGLAVDAHLLRATALTTPCARLVHCAHTPRPYLLKQLASYSFDGHVT